MGMGATAGAVIRMFLRNSGKVLLSGIAGGVFGGTAVSRILQSQLHGVERFDPWTLAVTCILLVTAGLFATWLPDPPRRPHRSDDGLTSGIDHPAEQKWPPFRES